MPWRRPTCTALNSTSSDQSKLSIYGATRSSDGAVTIMVINKTYGALNSTLSLPGVKATSSAQVFLYSGANLAAIVPQPAATVAAASAAGGPGTLPMTFPAQSITLIVVPQ